MQTPGGYSLVEAAFPESRDRQPIEELSSSSTSPSDAQLPMDLAALLIYTVGNGGGRLGY